MYVERPNVVTVSHVVNLVFYRLAANSPCTGLCFWGPPLTRTGWVLPTPRGVLVRFPASQLGIVIEPEPAFKTTHTGGIARHPELDKCESNEMFVRGAYLRVKSIDCNTCNMIDDLASNTPCFEAYDWTFELRCVDPCPHSYRLLKYSQLGACPFAKRDVTAVVL